MKIYKDQVFEGMQKDGTVVLNILPESEFRKLHIKGSESLPWGKDPDAFFKEVVQKYGRTKNFIVYGERFGLLDSFMAARVLEEGDLKVRNYAGGLQEWYRSGLPVDGTLAHPEPVEGA